MKRTVILIIIIFQFSLPAFSQLKSHVDERFELASIAFRLAEIPEYSQCLIKEYADDIDHYFTPFREDELIGCIRHLRNEFSIGYNAVSSAAAVLEVSNGKVSLRNGFDPADISKLDPRWRKEEFLKFVDLLDKFYRESKFQDFFDDHEKLYVLAEESLDSQIADFRTEWFASFFGKPFDPKLEINICLCNGPNNYAYDEGVVIGTLAGSDNSPAFMGDVLYFVLHELAHHYTNPVFFAHWPEMEEAAERIYSSVQEEMRLAGYGNARSVFCEWMNNLFCIMYYREYLSKYGYERAWCRMNMERGFIWMRRSTSFMDSFYADRKSYCDITGFIPQIVNFVHFIADNMVYVQREFDLRHPYVTNVYPAVGSDISNVTEVRIEFSEPMRSDCQGLWWVEDTSIELLPFKREGCDWESERVFVIAIDNDRLKKGKMYGVKLPVETFRSEEDYQIDDRYIELFFNTGT